MKKKKIIIIVVVLFILMLIPIPTKWKNGITEYKAILYKYTKVLEPSLEVIELEEHSVTMNNNKAIDTKTDNVYKITNATGKTFNFKEFRHL